MEKPKACHCFSLQLKNITHLTWSKTKQKNIIPLQEEFQESGKTGGAVHVPLLIQDLDRVSDQLFPVNSQNNIAPRYEEKQ